MHSELQLTLFPLNRVSAFAYEKAEEDGASSDAFISQSDSHGNIGYSKFVSRSD